ncbi:MAG TPA: valine--tRNA ligase [Longimicrobiales bacterium]
METVTRTEERPAALAPRYDPAEVEARWTERWAREPFTADPHSDKPPFCIVIPPPNVTGALHLGHAFDNTIIDTLVRYKRMRGFETLFQPGTDHAGIATQVQVERALRKEGLTRHDLGRERFVERVWAWVDRYGPFIERQLQRLGVSAAWDRKRFTMDEGLSAAVRRQFVTLYHQGKVYRRERIVNWDPASQTVLSDLEVEREERRAEMYELAYELEGGGALRVATVRPETIFADAAVAVHPEDERYAGLVGRRARIPLTDRWVPVIADASVERDFGTGALKVTPAHDPTDFEIGERHGLPRPMVIDKDARLTGELVPAEFRGLDRFEARERVVAALEREGALVGRREHTVPLGLSQRTGVPVEPLLSLQWFYDTDEAAAKALKRVESGETRFVPERYTKVAADWLRNLRHWCISRQLWWGHRIPAWYDAEGNVYVPPLEDPMLDPPDDPRYAGLELTQDPDVFDTWFSSNLWPFSTLGWPDEDDPFLRKFYPTSVLVTGYDILSFWVARMQIAAEEFTGRRPFDAVLLHGLVLDAEGRKMSKSKDNGVDPLDVIARYGADALRFALSRASTGGQDVRWDDRQVEMGRNFATKLWNAARFVTMQEGEAAEGPLGGSPNLADRWLLSRLQRAVGEVTRALDELDLGAANRAAYDFVWSEFCDWYLEAAKAPLREGDGHTLRTVRHALDVLLRLLHPLMPFVTSELYAAIGRETQVALAPWPEVDEGLIDDAGEAEFERVRSAVSAARALRAEAELPPSQTVDVWVAGPGAAALLAHRGLFEPLARAILREGTPEGSALAGALPDAELRLPLAGQVDVAAYAARQRARLERARGDAERSRQKLANERFVQGAPAEVVAEERRRLEEAEALAERLEAVLAELG